MGVMGQTPAVAFLQSDYETMTVIETAEAILQSDELTTEELHPKAIGGYVTSIDTFMRVKTADLPRAEDKLSAQQRLHPVQCVNFPPYFGCTGHFQKSDCRDPELNDSAEKKCVQ